MKAWLISTGKLVPPIASTTAKVSNASTVRRISAVWIEERSRGSVTRRKRCHAVAPNTLAAGHQDHEHDRGGAPQFRGQDGAEQHDRRFVRQPALRPGDYAELEQG